MKKFFYSFFLVLISVAIAFGTVRNQKADPSRPMPYTDYISIESTGQASIATITQLITARADGNFVTIHNESGDMLRIGTDTAALTNGFGLPAGGVIGLRLWADQNLYVDCSGTANISYIKGN